MPYGSAGTCRPWPAYGYEYSFCPYDSARGLIFDSLRHDFVTSWFDDLPAPARGSFFPLVVLVPYSWVICGLNVISEKVKLNSIIGSNFACLDWTFFVDDWSLILHHFCVSTALRWSGHQDAHLVHLRDYQFNSNKQAGMQIDGWQTDLHSSGHNAPLIYICGPSEDHGDDHTRSRDLSLFRLCACLYNDVMSSSHSHLFTPALCPADQLANAHRLLGSLVLFTTRISRSFVLLKPW